MSDSLSIFDPRRRGFNFIELMFAVAVLSIGLTGVAGAVYVGVLQTRSTLDETSAAAVARQAASQFGQLATRANVPDGGPTPIDPDQVFVSDSGPPARQTLKTAYVCDTDTRYAWVPLVRRLTDVPTADVWVAVLRAGSAPVFDAQAVAGKALYPPSVQMTAHVDAATGETTLSFSNGVEPAALEALAPGSFLLTSPATAGLPTNQVLANPLAGRVIRLSERVSGDAWTVDPASNLGPAADGQTATAYVFGRARTDPLDASKGYRGESQCVAIYATTVLLQ